MSILEWFSENWEGVALVSIAIGSVVRGIVKREKIVLSIGRVFEIGIGDKVDKHEAIVDSSTDEEKAKAMQPNFFRFFMDVGSDLEILLDNIETYYRGYITAFLKDNGYYSQAVVDRVVEDVVRTFPELTDRLITSVFRNGLPHSNDLSDNTKQLIKVKGFVSKETDDVYAWYIGKFGTIKNTIHTSIERGWSFPHIGYKSFFDYCERYQCNDVVGELTRFYDNVLEKRKNIITLMLMKYKKQDRKEVEASIIKSFEWLHLALGLGKILKKR